MQELAQAIRAAKGSKSLEEFAADMGCSFATAQRWTTGATRPSSRAHINLLAAAGVPRTLLLDAEPSEDATVAV